MSSSSETIPVIEMIDLYQLARVAQNCSVLVTAFFVYDWILCLGREYQYIWQSGMSWASRLLYLCTRCTYLLSVLLVLATIPPMSDNR
ncbi:hypothetical protein BC628DRAFT_845473 [Trametes gibbosa]|nr:hypothetical protein BC628DRAFT_845473 [Trametes gibbosa]